MPRTKGSKNKPKKNDIDVKIAEAQKVKEFAEAEVAKTEASIAELKGNLKSLQETLKAQKADAKTADKALAKLTAKKAKADAAAEVEAKKAEAQEMVNRLLAEGMSADEILEKLK